jgi:hypothetical protein
MKELPINTIRGKFHKPFHLRILFSAPLHGLLRKDAVPTMEKNG